MGNPREVVVESRHNSAYIVSLVAALRSVVQIPENYEELIWKLLNRMDIVANTYRLEKEKVVGAVMGLLLNRLNPRHQNIFKLFFEMMKIRTSSWICFVKQYSVLRSGLLSSCKHLSCFSKEDSCVWVNASQVTIVDELSSNQEKAENKVIVHSAYAIKTTEGLIMLRSFSGETEIMIIAISHIDTSKHVLVDYGNGKNR